MIQLNSYSPEHILFIGLIEKIENGMVLLHPIDGKEQVKKGLNKLKKINKRVQNRWYKKR